MLTSGVSGGLSAVRSTSMIWGFPLWVLNSNDWSLLFRSSRTVRASNSSKLFGLFGFSAPMRSQNDIRVVSLFPAAFPDVISLHPLDLTGFLTVLHSTWGTSDSESSDSCLLHAAPLFTILVREKVVSVTCSVSSFSLRFSFCLFDVFFDFPELLFSILPSNAAFVKSADCFEISFCLIEIVLNFDLSTNCFSRANLSNVFFVFFWF